MDPRPVADLIQATGAAVAAARMVRLGISRFFPAILIYLAFLAGINLVFGLLNIRSYGYFYSYVVLEPLKCLLGVIAVRELFSLIFRDYPGIRTVGRWAIYAALALAVGISFAAEFWSKGAQGRSRIVYFEDAQRSVIFTLALVTGTILVFLSRYPLRLRRNTILSGIFFSALFLADAARLMIDSLDEHLFNNYVDIAESAFACLCLVAWASLLKSEDEAARTRVTYSTPREEYLLQQLTALNQVMARAGRR